MKITNKDLIDLIQQIEHNLDQLNKKLVMQEKTIQALEAYNQRLKQNNLDTLDQIQEYIKELEQIRNYHVNSNNYTSR